MLSLQDSVKESSNYLKKKVKSCNRRVVTSNSNKSVKTGEHNTFQNSVENLATEVSTDSMSETHKQILDINMENIGNFSERLGENYDSYKSNCCEKNIFCDCNRCKEFIEKLSTTKPNINSKYICHLCNKKFVWKSSFKTHEKTKCNTLKLFHCNYCAKGFTVQSTVKSHISKCHSFDGKKHRCDVCDKDFSCKETLLRHKNNKHFAQKLLNHSFSCELCQKVYKNKKHLSRHKMDSHSDEKFECGHCSKICSSKNRLKTHIQSAHFQTQVKCDRPNCNKQFSSALSLKQHMQIVHLKSFDSVFICETCGKSFFKKQSLQKHLLIHTDEKNYVCQVCGKSFRTDSNLEQHSRTHSDNRPFSCDHCPMAFRIKHHLRQHMSVHGMVHSSVKRKHRSN